MFLFNFFGFLFFIAMGSEQIDAYKHAPYVSLQMFLSSASVNFVFVSGSCKSAGNGLDGNFDRLCVSC